MKTIKLFLLLNVFAHAGTFGAAYEPSSDRLVPILKTGAIRHPALDKRMYSLLNIAKVAAIDEVAKAADIDLKKIEPGELMSLIGVVADGDLRESLKDATTNQACAEPTDAVSFIKRCVATFKALPAEQRQKCLFEECYEAGCPATRSANPQVRETFERMIGDAIAPRHVETYCAFAAGYLLQDVRLLEQCRRQNKKIKTVVIIDPSYQSLTLLFSGHKNAGIYVPANQSMDTLIDYKQLKDRGGSLKVLLKVNLRAKIVQQFIECIRSLYPTTFQGINVYADAATYVRDCQDSPPLRADLLVGCDIKHSDIAHLDEEWKSTWEGYLAVEGRGLQISAIAARLSVFNIDQNSAFLNVKATTGMQTQRSVFDKQSIRTITEDEQKALEEQSKKELAALTAGKTFKMVTTAGIF